MDSKDLACPVREEINAYCSCPKTECENHGLCCTCIVAHKKRVNDPILKRFPHCLRDLVKEAMAEAGVSSDD